MLTDMGTILRKAKKEGYGVAAPNVWSRDSQPGRNRRYGEIL